MKQSLKKQLCPYEKKQGRSNRLTRLEFLCPHALFGLANSFSVGTSPDDVDINE